MSSSVASKARVCYQSYESCLSIIKEITKRSPWKRITAELPPDSSQEAPPTKTPLFLLMENQLGRFNMWTSIIGVFAGSTLSMDYRLRDAPEVRDLIVRLVDSLSQNLAYLEGICGKYQTALDPGSTFEKSADKYKEQLQTLDDDVRCAIQLITENVDTLHRLSNAMLRAGSEDRNNRASRFKITDEDGRDIGESWKTTFALKLCELKFPMCSDKVRERLASAMLARKKRLLYRQAHQKKMARPAIENNELPPQVSRQSEIEGAVTPSEMGTATETQAKAKVGVDSTAAHRPTKSMRSWDTAATPLDPQRVLRLPTPSRASSAKSAPLDDGKRLVYPPAPRPEQGDEAICPYCCLILPDRIISKPSMWKQHVLRDIDPYLCLEEDCSKGSHLFNSRNEWIQHTLQEHRLQWRCTLRVHPKNSGPTFSDRESFEHHLDKDHPGVFTKNQLSALVEKSCHAVGPAFENCPLCGFEGNENIDSHSDRVNTSMEDHIAYHLIYVALQCIPWQDDEQNEAASDSSSTGAQTRETLLMRFDFDTPEQPSPAPNADIDKPDDDSQEHNDGEGNSLRQADWGFMLSAENKPQILAPMLIKGLGKDHKEFNNIRRFPLPPVSNIDIDSDLSSWLFDHERFQKWNNSRNDHIYLTGPLGCGKSTLLERATIHWIVSRSERGDIGVTITLRPESDGQDVRAFKFPDQVFRVLQDDLVTLSNYFSWVGGRPDPPVEPGLDFIAGLLQDICQHIHVLIILDLEYSPRWVAHSVLHHFLSMQATKARFSLIVAALQVPGGLPKIRTSDQFRVDWNNTMDIDDYVLKHIRSEGRATTLLAEAAAYRMVLSKAGSNFLWTDLVIESFKECETEEEMSEYVDRLPKDLVRGYSKRLSAVKTPWCYLLIWLALAPGPLSVELVRAAMPSILREYLDPPEDFAYISWDDFLPWELCGFCVDVYIDGVKMWVMSHSSAKQYILEQMTTEDDGMGCTLRLWKDGLFRSFRTYIFEEQIFETEQVVLRHFATHIRAYMAYGKIWEPEENQAAAKHMARDCALLGIENPLKDLLKPFERPLGMDLERTEAAAAETIVTYTPLEGITEDVKASRDEQDEPISSETQQATESLESYPSTGIKPDDIVIAVMGMTGSGKTTFVNYFSDEPLEIGHGLESCTQEVQVARCTLDGGRKIYLVDTPGFDDSFRSDTEILREIASWLSHAHRGRIKLTGMIYLHRIMDVRIGGAGIKNIRMFKKLSGDDSLASVVLATTMWGYISDSTIGEQRERQLMTESQLWKTMIDHGSSVFRQDNGRASAMRIIQYLIDRSRPVVLDLQRELIDEKKLLGQTEAGQEITSEIEKQRQHYDKRLKQLEQELKDALAGKDQEMSEELEETREAYRARIANGEDDVKRLQTGSEQLLAEMRQRHEREIEDMRKAVQQRDATIQETKTRLAQLEEALETREREDKLRKLRAEYENRPGISCIMM